MKDKIEVKEERSFEQTNKILALFEGYKQDGHSYVLDLGKGEVHRTTIKNLDYHEDFHQLMCLVVQIEKRYPINVTIFGNMCYFFLRNGNLYPFISIEGTDKIHAVYTSVLLFVENCLTEDYKLKLNIKTPKNLFIN